MSRFLIVIAILAALCGGCQRSPTNTLPTAQSIYAAALEKAQLVNKPVFVVFTRNGFGVISWPTLRRTKMSPSCSNKYFLFVHLRMDANPGAEEMYYERGIDRGVPAYTIVDSHGKFLADSGDVGENVGFPNTDDEVDRYVEMLKIACPQITAEEQTLLRDKLQTRRVNEILNN